MAMLSLMETEESTSTEVTMTDYSRNWRRGAGWWRRRLGPTDEDMPRTHTYVVWGQCPLCLDCLTIEIDSPCALTPTDIKGALSSRAGAHVYNIRAGWKISKDSYQLRIRDARVTVRNGSEGWNIFHKTCDKPIRMLTVQKKASPSPRLRISAQTTDEKSDSHV